MLKSLLRELVAAIFPDVFLDADRYHYLRNQVEVVHRWCDGEAADVADYLLAHDSDHWRALGEAGLNKPFPLEISRFREWLYARREQHIGMV